MFDAKKLLDQFLGSQVPGAGGTVKDRAGQLGQLAKDNPLATGAIAAVLLGTGTGRQLTGSALKLGGLAAIAGLGYQAYKNWQAGQPPQAAETSTAMTAEPPSRMSRNTARCRSRPRSIPGRFTRHRARGIAVRPDTVHS